MLVGKIIQETGGRRGARPVYNERTCSQCRHWDLEQFQQKELGEDGVLREKFFARCVNLKSPSEGRYMEAEDGCGDFELDKRQR